MGITLYRPAPDGWIAVLGDGWTPDYWVRCQEDPEDGRLAVTQLLIDGRSSRLRSAHLRDVPLGRIEATINADRLLTLAARDGAAAQPDPLVHRLREGPRPDFRPRLGLPPSPLKPSAAPLTRPTGEDPDGFYANVARRYQELVRKTAKPAVTMAEEAGVPVATARRWIAEARRRNHLPRGRQGRAQ